MGDANISTDLAEELITPPDLEKDRSQIRDFLSLAESAMSDLKSIEKTNNEMRDIFN